MSRLLIAFALISFSVLLTACGRNTTAQLLAEDTPQAAPRFTLRQLPADGALGSARITAEPRVLDDGSVLVSIRAGNADRLRGLFYELDYDSTRFAPVAAQFLNALAPTSELLSLSSFAEPGTVQHGAVVVSGSLARGLSGSAVVAELRFAPRAFVPQRGASKAPRSKRSQVTLNLDAETKTLAWGYANEGDYDQNSEVNVADLAPLGTNFQANTDGTGPFPPGSKLAMIDGDQNGELNIADLSPIGTNIQRVAASYNVYRSLDPEDIPTGEEPSTIDPLGFVNLTDTISEVDGGQRRFSFELEALNNAWFYWVRPCDLVDGGGNEGVPSNVVSTGGVAENLPPSVSVTATPDAGDAPLTVNFDAGASSDPDGTLIQFAWDFNGDGLIDDTTTEPTVSTVYQNPGVFTARVLATDNGAATGAAQITISVNEVGNAAPVAALTLDPTSGTTPLDVTLDASGSTDDGSIINHEWDFDGDGVFDATTSTEPTAVQRYETAGSLEPAVRVTDNFGLTATASASLALTQGDLPPVAVIEGETDFVTGTQTYSAAASFDPDGTIVRFRWDLDADGTFDGDTGANAAITLTVPSGTHPLLLEVTDDDGLTATATLTLRVRGAGSDHVPPTASFTVDPQAAPSGVQRTLDASASAVGDGEDATLEFLWDFTNNGTDDLTTSDPVTTFTYTTPGSFLCKLTVRQLNSDGTDDESEAFVPVGVTGGANLNPVAALTATPRIGIDPHEVLFDASASVDFDGTIDRFEWDIDGDLIADIDTGTDPTLARTFTVSETVVVSVFLTDNDGGFGTASIQVVTSDPNNPPPTAVLLVSPETSTGPSEVTFNASASTDDETIVSYQFDFNGDGTVDRISEDPVVVLKGLSINGTHNATVRVIDDDGGLSIAGDSYTINGGFTRSVIEENFLSEGTVSARVTGSGATALANVIYYSFATDKVHYVNSTDATGLSWTSPALAFVGSNIRDRMSIRNVLFARAVAYTQGNGVFFNTSTDTTGLDWNDPLTVVGRGQLTDAGLTVASVNPAVTFIDTAPNPDQLKFIRSTSPSGATWPTTEVVAASGTSSDPRLFDAVPLFVNGRPAVFYTLDSEFQNLMMVRATSADGSTWGTPVEIPNSRHDDGFDAKIIDGRPAVAVGGFFEAPRFIRANDADGSSWGSSVLTAPTGGHLERSLLAEVDGRPCIFYVERDGRFVFIPAFNSTGSSWDDPQTVGFGGVFDFPEQMISLNNKAVALVSRGSGSNAGLDSITQR